MLKGLVIPQRCETAYAVYAPLCVLDGVDPDALYWDADEGEETTHQALFKRLWSAAFDDVSDLPSPILRTKMRPRDPYVDPAMGFDLEIEPPF
ncbi:hypothetical protein GCM10022226_62160 [Sphaerisporangium flaviroseum]|uniref:Uncharacterized protein n=1 Tax=Sphaerisporangium flaviroseum TaxID=509199 RepID=A0ABP7J1S1_9ACTN